MSVAIRRAGARDLAAVMDLYAQAIDGGRALKRADAARIFRRMARYPSYRLFVARAGGRIVGAFELLIMDNLGHLGAPSAVVEDVAVLPEWQGRGVGKAMMRFALEECRKAGCYKLALSSNLKRAAAHSFYESLGFEKHGFSFLIRPA